MQDPSFKTTIPIATVITGDVYYSIEQASSGRYFDGKIFAEVVAGKAPPTFPLPEGRFGGYRRLDVPIPPAVFTADIYICIYMCNVGGEYVAITAEIWDLRDPSQFPVNVKMDDWFYVVDHDTGQGAFKHVKGPE